MRRYDRLCWKTFGVNCTTNVWSPLPRPLWLRRISLSEMIAPRMAELILSHLSENSVLHSPRAKELQPYMVGPRKRLATCSGISWFLGHHLAVVNLYGGHLRVYRFHEPAATNDPPTRVELLHEVTEGIGHPEDVSVTSDGRFLAITHTKSDDFGVSIHSVDPATLAVRAPGRMLRRGVAFHGVRFSPDSRHLAFTEVGDPGYIEVVRVPSGEQACLFVNQHRPLKPKSVVFSRDGRFAIIAWALNVRSHELSDLPRGILAAYPFDMATGTIGSEPVAEFHGSGLSIGNVDMCTVLPTRPGGRYEILAANQGFDVVSAFEFDADERALDYTGVFLGGLSFPHGLDGSADGRFVAVTNNGNDTISIARVTPRSP